MKFYLGADYQWLGRTDVPLMVSVRRLARYRRKTYPQASGPWTLDSGGFTQLDRVGWYEQSPAEFVDDVERVSEGVGRMPEWAAPQDWMCEPWMVAKTGLSVSEHQARTLESVLTLRSLSSVPFIPVLQGWTLDDYLAHWQAYADAGVILEDEPVVGLGSVCRRQNMRVAEHIVLALRPLRLHGFGVKTVGLQRFGYLLESADSQAYAVGLRRVARAGKPRGHRPRCVHGQPSAHCLTCALSWRERVLRSLDYQQTHLLAVP